MLRSLTVGKYKKGKREDPRAGGGGSQRLPLNYKRLQEPSGQSANSQLVTVSLRIEGADVTIFEGQISTRAHDIRIPGTAHDVIKLTYPTPTGALDDAAHECEFSFDGKYQAKYNDIFITRIGDTAQDNSRFWGILLNYKLTSVGGCQQRITAGDEVLFAFDAFTKKQYLKLTGPTVATVGVSITLTVIDGDSDAPVCGAVVGGQRTDVQGQATLVFRSPGVRELKAEKERDAIRSNQLCINVSR